MYTAAFIQCSQQIVHNVTSTEITLPMASRGFTQSEIGQDPINIKDHTSLLKLVNGHPVIDHIFNLPKVSGHWEGFTFFRPRSCRMLMKKKKTT